jgi:hypothetical protein
VLVYLDKLRYLSIWKNILILFTIPPPYALNFLEHCSLFAEPNLCCWFHQNSVHGTPTTLHSLAPSVPFAYFHLLASFYTKSFLFAREYFNLCDTSFLNSQTINENRQTGYEQSHAPRTPRYLPYISNFFFFFLRGVPNLYNLLGDRKFQHSPKHISDCDGTTRTVIILTLTKPDSMQHPSFYIFYIYLYKKKHVFAIFFSSHLSVYYNLCDTSFSNNWTRNHNRQIGYELPHAKDFTPPVVRSKFFQRFAQFSCPSLWKSLGD